MTKLRFLRSIWWYCRGLPRLDSRLFPWYYSQNADRNVWQRKTRKGLSTVLVPNLKLKKVPKRGKLLRLLWDAGVKELADVNMELFTDLLVLGNGFILWSMPSL